MTDNKTEETKSSYQWDSYFREIPKEQKQEQEIEQDHSQKLTLKQFIKNYNLFDRKPDEQLPQVNVNEWVTTEIVFLAEKHLYFLINEFDIISKIKVAPKDVILFLQKIMEGIDFLSKIITKNHKVFDDLIILKELNEFREHVMISLEKSQKSVKFVK